MSLRTSVVAACATVAVLFTAGAIPAFAGIPAISGTGTRHGHTRTPLVRAIVTDQPALRERVTRARVSFPDRGTPDLGQIARAVGSVHADRAQLAAQRSWVDGVHCEQTGDRQLALAGTERAADRAEAGPELQRAVASLTCADQQIGRADARLRIPVARPVLIPGG